MYDNYACQVEHRGVLWDPVAVTTRVKQDCWLPSILFLMVLDVVTKRAMSRQRAILWSNYLSVSLQLLGHGDEVKTSEAAKVGPKIYSKKCSRNGLNA